MQHGKIKVLNNLFSSPYYCEILLVKINNIISLAIITLAPYECHRQSFGPISRI